MGNLRTSGLKWIELNNVGTSKERFLYYIAHGIIGDYLIYKIENDVVLGVELNYLTKGKMEIKMISVKFNEDLIKSIIESLKGIAWMDNQIYLDRSFQFISHNKETLDK